MTIVSRRCRVCGQDSSVEVEPERFAAYRNGGLVQNVWPDRSIEWREQLISGTHPDCWDRLFGDLDD